MNTPKIRFKGFKDDWEQRKVLDLLVQPVTDGPHETPRLVENGIPFISVDAIVDNKIDFSRKRGDVSEEYDAECCKKYKPQYHDVYVVKSGSTVGKVAIVETTDRFNIWSPLAALRCEGKTKPYYLFYLLQTRRMQAQILDKASNGTQPNLSMRELEKFDVLVTDNAEEQQRIGDYFKSLDHLITLHQRKCDETKQLKKFMLQKMFPKNGEKNPEIRFEGFTDAWEQRKFEDVGTVAMCKRIFKEQTSEEGEVPFYKIGTFGGIPDAYITRELFEEYKKNYQYPNKGDILISASGSIGRTVEYTGKDEYYQDSNIVWLKHENDLDNSFLKVLYGVIEWSCEGSTIKRLYNDNFLKTEFMLPKIEEQIKIGEYFSKLDHLITLHQRKCEKLKALKKFMLQNMFI
jgi:type I restriction enzyme S subunit